MIFDLDDTLYNERDFVYCGFKAVANYLGKEHGLNVNDIYNSTLDIFHKYGRGKIFNILCHKYDIDEDVGKLVGVYRNTVPDIELYEDGLYILKTLKGNYGLGIITDGKNTVQWNKIKALNIEKYVDKIIVTDDYGRDYWKPSKEPYRDILNYFNIGPKEAIYIGDNPHKDFISAKILGINTIRIIREVGDHMNTFLSDKYEADYKINSLTEIEKIIGLINEKS